MNATRLQGLRKLGLALVLGVVLVGCASGPKAPPPEIAQRIQAASSRADHESLAGYFMNEAATARASAENHRKMARSYQAQVSQRGGSGMAAHCNAVVRAQETIAAEYESMAGGHRELAQQAKP